MPPYVAGDRRFGDLKHIAIMPADGDPFLAQIMGHGGQGFIDDYKLSEAMSSLNENNRRPALSIATYLRQKCQLLARAILALMDLSAEKFQRLPRK